MKLYNANLSNFASKCRLAIYEKNAKARARGISRFHDLYLEPPLRALFPQASTKERDQKLIAEKLAELNLRLDQLEAKLSTGPFAIGSAFTFADCALAPTFFFANLMLPMLGSKPFTEGRPKLAAWWSQVQKRPAVEKVLAEQQQALMERMRQQPQ